MKRSYSEFLQSANVLLDSNDWYISKMANFCALYFDFFKIHWVGFYIVNDGKLKLGPFCGPVACTNIEYNKGVCGNAWHQKSPIIVANVHEYEGHIACSSFSNSELVLPLIDANGDVFAVLDIDSTLYDDFDDNDVNALKSIMNLIKID